MDDNDANEVQSSVIVDKMLPFTIQDESMNHQSKSRHWNSVFPLLAAFVTGVGTALAFQNIRRTRGYNRIQ
jgi:hypothetical protein